MTFYKGKKDPTEKFKKEVYALLMRPDRVDGAKGIMITREEMALFRVEQLFDQVYKQLRKQFKDEMKEKRITKRVVKKKLKLTTPELIERGIKLLSPEEKERIFASQQKRLIKFAEDAIPRHFLLSEKQLTEEAIADYSDIQELLTITPEELLEKYPELFSKKKKRKPSARNLFIGKMMSTIQISMKEASNMWQGMSEEEKEAYKPD